MFEETLQILIGVSLGVPGAPSGMAQSREMPIQYSPVQSLKSSKEWAKTLFYVI
jgi:hypothetical protein